MIDQKQAELSQKSPDKGLYRRSLDELRGKPENLVDQFRWSDYLMDRSYYEKELLTFCSDNPVLRLDGKETVDHLENLRELTKSTFEAFLTPEDTKHMNYHNPVHGQITAIVGTKLFLGAVKKMTQEDPAAKDYFDAHPTFAKQLLRTVSTSFALHEIDDWWMFHANRNPSPEEQEQIKQTLATNKIALTKKLSDLGISLDDFNRCIALDQYALTTQKTVEQVLGDTYKRFLDEKKEEPEAENQASHSSIFTQLEEKKELRGKIFTAIAHSIRAADFMQILNRGYLQPAVILDETGRIVAHTELGPLALAEEMRIFRPQALPTAGWLKNGSDPPDVDWKKVHVGDTFFHTVAKPNIAPGIRYMKYYDPQEYTRARRLLVELELKLIMQYLQNHAHTFLHLFTQPREKNRMK